MEPHQVLNNRKNVGVALVAYFEMMSQFSKKYNPSFGLQRSDEELLTGNDTKFSPCSQLFVKLKGTHLQQTESILADLRNRLEIAEQRANNTNDEHAAKWFAVVAFFKEFVAIVDSGVIVLRELDIHLQNAREVNLE
ncbi:MAG: hypothetical protein WCL30_04275 [Pseudomonadota bacterium]